MDVKRLKRSLKQGDTQCKTFDIDSTNKKGRVTLLTHCMYLLRQTGKHYDGVEELLNIYNEAYRKKEEFIRTGKSKTTLAGNLAKKLNATYIHAPTADIRKLKKTFLGNDILALLYRYFIPYITALKIYVLLKDNSVILERSWYSSASYFIARQSFYNHENMLMPLKGDSVYRWPKDLLKPDIVLFLEVDENIRLQRINERHHDKKIPANFKRKFERDETLLKRCSDYRNNVITAYKNMQDPEVTLINANVAAEEILEEVYSKVKLLL